MEPNLNVGLLGLGSHFYLPQFKGLKSRLQGYVRSLVKSLCGSACSKLRLALLKALERWGYDRLSTA